MSKEGSIFDGGGGGADLSRAMSGAAISDSGGAGGGGDDEPMFMDVETARKEGNMLLDLGPDDEAPDFSDDDGEVDPEMDQNMGLGGGEYSDDGEAEEGAEEGGAASAGAGGTMMPDSAELALRFSAHGNPVYSVAVSPVDASLVLSGGGDDGAYLWDRSSGEVHAQLGGHSDSVVSVAFSHDGTLAATGSLDGGVRVWRAATGELVQVLEGPSEDVDFVSWHPKGDVLLAGSSDGTAWMWLATTGACMQVFAGHEARVGCGSFTGSGKMVVTGSDDGTVRVWNPKTGACAHTFGAPGKSNRQESAAAEYKGSKAPISCLVVHPTKPLVLTGGQDCMARLYNVKAKLEVLKLAHEAGAAAAREHDIADDVEYGTVEAVGFCRHDGFDWLATGTMDGRVCIWSHGTNAGQLRFTCVLPPPDGTVAASSGGADLGNGGVTALEWHPDPTADPVVFSSMSSGIAVVWDARTGAALRVLHGQGDMIIDLQVVVVAAASAPIVLTGGDDNNVIVWDLGVAHVPAPSLAEIEAATKEAEAAEEDSGAGASEAKGDDAEEKLD